LSVPNPFVHEKVSVTWNVHNAEIVLYGTEQLPTAIANTRTAGFILRDDGVTLPVAMTDIIRDVLDTIRALPPTEMHKKITLADRLFESLTVLTTNPYNPVLMRMFWRAVFDLVWPWEDANEKVHKGTPFSFMAQTYLRSGDLPSAYICFFNAFEEDKRSYPHIPKKLKDAPVYMTTSLVDNPRNFLYQTEVVPLRNKLQDFMTGYKGRTGRTMTLPIFDQKFLQNDSLEEIKRVFVGNFREIHQLNPLNTPRLIFNDYSKLKIIDTLFNLALVIDQTLQHKFAQENMGNAVYRLALHHWNSRATSNDIKDFLRKIQPQLNNVTPDQTLPHILGGTATFDGNPLTPLEAAIFTAYHLRNFAGHNIKGSQVIVEKYDEILALMMDALFLAVETL
jgi:hypothetical protein